MRTFDSWLNAKIGECESKEREAWARFERRKMKQNFIEDLIDHKERVAKYMLIASDEILGKWANYSIPATSRIDENSTLLGLIEHVGYANKNELKVTIAMVKFTGQLGTIALNTMLLLRQHQREWIEVVISDLFQRAASHDNSKFGAEEFDLYNQAFPDLQKHAYGSDGYKAAVKLLGPALGHHLSVNDHHPEYFENGISQMNAIQLIEMCCDWMAASERGQTNIEQGLMINKKRFGIDDDLFELIKNTVEYLKRVGGS
jgi:hypothetical protein